jgi:hypothetical protein
MLSGKVCLLDCAMAGGSVFAVGKRDSPKKREVWDGGRVSAAAVQPPKPPNLASPSTLIDLQTSAAEPFLLSKRDGRCLFDQLRCPPELVPYFCRPSVTVQELIDTGIVNWKQIIKSHRGSCSLHRSMVVIPASLVWPMGFSWSSYIAQNTMLSVCDSAGLHRGSRLAPDLDIPKRFDELHALATDDILMFHTDAKHAEDRLRKVDAAFAKHGVLRHTKKDVDATASGTCIGVDLDSGLFLAPSAASYSNLLLCCIFVSTSVQSFRLTPKQLSALLGLAQWFALLNRPLLSLFSAAYIFARLQPDGFAVEVPAEVKQELLMFSVLSVYCEADLTRPWCGDLVASDASQVFGFGVCVATVGEKRAQEVGRHAERAGAFVRLQGDEPLEKARTGCPLRLKVSRYDFRTVVSHRASYKAHSGALEAAGVTMMLRWVTRSNKRHSCRVAALVDAQAVLHALSKGRSSAATIRTEVKRAGAITLGSDILVRYVYIPSESNPADAPSRGITGKSLQPARRAHEKHTCCDPDCNSTQHTAALEAAFCREFQINSVFDLLVS